MESGVIYFIGAGPGPADLITVRGERALRRADLIVVDSLLPASFLDDLAIPLRGREVVHLAPGDTRDRQDEITRMVCEAATRGKIVARLKSGDPLVFGRPDEELAAVAREGVPWELIPGPTSGTACLTAAGLPPTWPESGRSFAVATGRTKGAEAGALPRADSLVIFMAVAVLGEVTDSLVADGWPAETPAVVLERGTRPWERRVRGGLAEIAARAQAEGVASPALLVVGDAARPRAFQRRPTILYTGLDPTNFRALGDVLHWPALEVVADADGEAQAPDVVAGLATGTFDWAVFTSRIGVASFFRALEDCGRDARALGGVTIVAAGAGTAEVLRRCGLIADATPSDSGSRGILAAMADARGGTVLLVQGTHAPRGLEDELRHGGNDIVRLALHRVVANRELGRRLPAHDVVYFASPSGVRAWRDAYGAAGFEREIWCMGHVTLTQVEELGFQGKVVSPYVPTNEAAPGAEDRSPAATRG